MGIRKFAGSGFVISFVPWRIPQRSVARITCGPLFRELSMSSAPNHRCDRRFLVQARYSMPLTTSHWFQRDLVGMSANDPKRTSNCDLWHYPQIRHTARRNHHDAGFANSEKPSEQVSNPGQKFFRLNQATICSAVFERDRRNFRLDFWAA